MSPHANRPTTLYSSAYPYLFLGVAGLAVPAVRSVAWVYLGLTDLIHVGLIGGWQDRVLAFIVSASTVGGAVAGAILALVLATGPYLRKLIPGIRDIWGVLDEMRGVISDKASVEDLKLLVAEMRKELKDSHEVIQAMASELQLEFKAKTDTLEVEIGAVSRQTDHNTPVVHTVAAQLGMPHKASILGVPTASRSASSPRTLRLLMVDDNEDSRRVNAKTLDSCGWTIQEYGTAEEAIAELYGQKTHYDALLVDLQLPDRPGHEIVKAARVSKSADRIVVHTGLEQSNPLIDEALRQGADAVVRKPCLPTRIDAVLRGADPGDVLSSQRLARI